MSGDCWIALSLERESGLILSGRVGIPHTSLKHNPYYEDQKEGLGLDFAADVEQAVDRIQQNPNLGSVYKISGIRRYVIQRFPFLIFYAEFDSLIWIIAIAHAKRKPDYWKSRIK
jgi:toxin ParE1/3/4